MKTITISLSDKTADETVQAEYFQIEDGWVTFKTEDHKAVVAYPEKRIIRIKSEHAEPNVTISASDISAHAKAEARKATSARWAGRS